MCSFCASWSLGLRLLQYIYDLLSSYPFIFGMLGILSPILGPSTDPGVGLGGIEAPYSAHRFGNGHIPSSTPFVEDFYSLCSVFTPVSPSRGWWWMRERWVYTVLSLLCPIVHHIVSFGCSCHDHSSLYPIVWILALD